MKKEQKETKWPLIKKGEVVAKVSVRMGRVGEHGIFNGQDVEDFTYVTIGEIRVNPAMWGIKDAVQDMILDGFKNGNR